MDAFLDKLKDVSRRQEEIEQKLQFPETASDPERLRTLMKELNALSPITEEYRRYEAYLKDADEAEQILASTDDREFFALALQEKKDAQRGAEESLERLKVLLLPKDPDDGKNVIVEIRAAAGGEEAALFAADAE